MPIMKQKERSHLEKNLISLYKYLRVTAEVLFIAITSVTATEAG